MLRVSLQRYIIHKYDELSLSLSLSSSSFQRFLSALSSASSSKDNAPLISQNIIEDTVCLRVARPDVENAAIVISNDSNVEAITSSKVSAKTTQKIKAKSKNTSKQTEIVNIANSSDSDSDDSVQMFRH